MAKCIFCERQLTAGAEDGTQPTKEHIIQYALGGSNGLVTHDVCKDCNSKLGETVDADFINQEFIGFLRLTHGIEGYSGTIPDVVLSARSLDNNEPGRVRFGSAANVDVSHEPVVIRDAKADGTEEILVAGMPDRALEIAAGIIAKAKKQNRTILTTSGDVAKSAEDLLAGAETETSDHYKASMKVQMIPLLRGYAKIAFGFLHLALGEQWTFSKDAGELRAVSRGEGTATDVKSLVVQGHTQIRSLFLGQETADPRTHLLGIIPHKDPVVLVSLFGGTFTYGFKVTMPEDLIYGALLANKAAVEVDPVSRQARPC